MAPNPWLKGYERIDNVRSGDVLDYVPGYLPSAIEHSTEGGISRAGVEAHRVPPHLWVSAKRGIKWQTVPLDQASRALYEESSFPVPTRTKTFCINYEVEGFAAEGGSWSNEESEWIAREVIIPIVQYFFELGLSWDWKGSPDASTEQISGSSFLNAPQRFSWHKWSTFNSLAGHRHVPGNSDRWDPGLHNLKYVNELAEKIYTGGVQPPAAKVEEDDMLIQYLSDPKQGGDGTLYFSNGINTWPIRSDETRVMYESLGQVRRVTNKDGESYTQVGDLKIPFKLQPYWLNRLNPTRVFFEDRPKAV